MLIDSDTLHFLDDHSEGDFSKELVWRLMVIDDEPTVCEMLCKFFEQCGYEVVSESDPEKALQRVKVFNPGCILMDIKMPRVSGVDLLARIKGHDPAVGIIMITGHGELETAIESMKLGAFDYVTKPFDLNFIKNLVALCLAAGKRNKEQGP